MDDEIYLQQEENSHRFVVRATSHGGELGHMKELRDGTVQFVRQDGRRDGRVFQTVDEALQTLRTNLNPDDAS
jgi:hypothetical protein